MQEFVKQSIEEKIYHIFFQNFIISFCQKAILEHCIFARKIGY